MIRIVNTNIVNCKMEFAFLHKKNTNYLINIKVGILFTRYENYDKIDIKRVNSVVIYKINKMPSNEIRSV